MSTQSGVQVAAQIPEEAKESLREKAIEKSSKAGHRVTISDLVREGLHEAHGIDVSPE